MPGQGVKAEVLFVSRYLHIKGECLTMHAYSPLVRR